MNKTVKCKTCGQEIAAAAVICPACGTKQKKPFYKRVWFWLLIVFVVIPVIAVAGTSGGESGGTNTPPTGDTAATNNVAATTDEAFAGDCGIAATAQMGESLIGFPQLTVSVKNISDKDISAIQFFAVPCDVYGDEIKGWTRQDKFYYDDTIAAGASDTLTYQFIEDSVKTVKLYVYSVYFADGTEWGDKEATEKRIEKYATVIEMD